MELRPAGMFNPDCVVVMVCSLERAYETLSSLRLVIGVRVRRSLHHMNVQALQHDAAEAVLGEACRTASFTNVSGSSLTDLAVGAGLEAAGYSVYRILSR